jgi:hypothetical protein
MKMLLLSLDGNFRSHGYEYAAPDELGTALIQRPCLWSRCEPRSGLGRLKDGRPLPPAQAHALSWIPPYGAV